MTTPGDPLTTLGVALNRYTALQDAMKTASDELTAEDAQLDDSSTPPNQEDNNGPIPTGG